MLTNFIERLQNKPLTTTCLIITTNGKKAKKLFNQLKFFHRFLNWSFPIDLFPDYEVLPYESLAIQSNLIYERLKILTNINKEPRIIIVEVGTLLRKLIPPSFATKNLILLQQPITFSNLKQNLENQGYTRVEQISIPGEYSIRGGIIDLFLGKDSYRLDFYDEELVSIHYLDVATQRSKESVKNIELLPVHEVILDSKNIENFKQNWGLNSKESIIYKQITNKRYVPGLENYLPFFYPKLFSLLEYFSSPINLIIPEDLKLAAENFSNLIQLQYQNFIDTKILPPEALFFSSKELEEQLAKLPKIKLSHNNNSIPTHKILVSNSSYYLETLKLPIIKTLEEFDQTKNQCATFDEFLNEDFTIRLNNQIFAFQAQHILANSTQTASSPTQISTATTLDLEQINPGNLLVHRNYGVGKFLMLVKEKWGDFILLEYAEGSKLYLSCDQLHLISRYLGNNNELNHLGNKRWATTKKQIKEQIDKLAHEILEIQAKRQLARKKPFKIPDEYQKFQEELTFPLTKDQESTLNAIQQDFLGEPLMDRLVCGDVGFGKTEIAMHAAFLSVYNNHQVIILAPTTLLVQQHLESFKRRFLNFPVNIEALTRKVSLKKRHAILQQFEDKKIDILITTLTIIPGKLTNLGLLVIDEEHRFGVNQKERLKKTVTQLGVLSLSATPIPRSLNLAMTGIKEISLLQTPPEKRLKIHTVVAKYQEKLIKEGINRELLRGGQIYFVHNRIEQLPYFFEILTKMFPETKIAILHSQSKNNLETMRLFLSHQIDILLATTVIESGLDFKNANTLIVTHAEKYGIANLHQLRGRVGRSHIQAYAYFLVGENLTSQAQKRLSSLATHDSLGSGFNLALEDLELRGAGEILGKKQSGAINNLGLNLYLELLQETIEEINAPKNKTQTELQAEIEGRIPENYLSDLGSRLVFYKRLNKCETIKQVREIAQELEDRFGKLPEIARNLLYLNEYKIRFRKLGIIEAKLLKQNWQLRFKETTSFFNLPGFHLFQKLGINLKYTSNSVTFTPHPNYSFWDTLEQLTSKLEKIFT